MNQEKTALLKCLSRQQYISELGCFSSGWCPTHEADMPLCSHPFTFPIYLQISSAAPAPCTRLVWWLLSLWHCSFFISGQQLKDAACPRDTVQNEAALWVVRCVRNKGRRRRQLDKVAYTGFCRGRFHTVSKTCLSCGPGYLLEKRAICMHASED